MDAIKRGAVFLAIAFVLGLLLAFVLPHERGRAAEDKKLLVGVGDDITGRLMEQILQRYQADGEESLARAGEEGTPLQMGEQDLDSYLFIDCCSNAGQWSLLTKDIDLGFYCSHISVAIVNQSEGFSIYGPAVMNGEVLGYWEEPEDIRTMAIPMKREHLAELVRDDIVDTPQFQTFIQYYNEIVEELNNKENLQALYGMDDTFWENVNLKFLYLPEP